MWLKWCNFSLKRVENIVGKRGNVGFLPCYKEKPIILPTVHFVILNRFELCHLVQSLPPTQDQV